MVLGHFLWFLGNFWCFLGLDFGAVWVVLVVFGSFWCHFGVFWGWVWWFWVVLVEFGDFGAA